MFSRRAPHFFIINAASFLACAPLAPAGPPAVPPIRRAPLVVLERRPLLTITLPFAPVAPLPRPYLQEVRPKPMRVRHADPLRVAPPLPTIVAAPTPPPESADILVTPDLPKPPPPAAEPAPEPREPRPPAPAMDEVLNFFREEPRRGNDKALGEFFDPTFLPPAPAPQPPSSATYRRK